MSFRCSSHEMRLTRFFKNHLVVVVILAFVLISAPNVYGVETQFQWNAFTSENSDIHKDFINSVRVTADNEVWVGTSDGLSLFSQGIWSRFAAGHDGIPEGDVIDIDITPNGSLWIAQRKAVTRYKNGKWTVFTGRCMKLPDVIVTTIEATKDEIVWVGTKSGLARLQGEKWTVFSSENSSLPDNSVRALAEGDDVLWIATSGGLTKQQDEKFEVVMKTGKGLKAGGISALAVDSKGGLWATVENAAVNNSLRRYYGGQWSVFSAPIRNIAPFNIDLVIGTDDSLWVGGQRGLARFSETGWQEFNSKNSPLIDDSVLSLASGSDGSLWVATMHGLFRVALFPWQSVGSPVMPLPATADDLTSSKDGVLWLIHSDGIAIFKDGHWEKIDSPKSRFLQLAIDETGKVWASDHHYLYGYAGGAWERIGPFSTRKGTHTITSINVAHNGGLWVGTSDMVLAYVGPDKKIQYIDAELPHQFVRFITKTEDGTLWVGTQNGLAHYRDGNWSNYKSIAGSNLGTIVAMTETNDGSLWVATETKGLFRLNEGSWARFTSPVDFLLRGIATTQDGDLWVMNHDGLARFDGGGEYWQLYTSKNSKFPQDATSIVASEEGTSLSIMGRYGNVIRFTPPRVRPVLHTLLSPSGVVSTESQVFALQAFDPAYLTEQSIFHYEWNVRKEGLLDLPWRNQFFQTRNMFFRTELDEGKYVIEATAIDRYGYRSNRIKRAFAVNKSSTNVTGSLRKAIIGIGGSVFIYMVLLFPLLALYPYSSLARTAVNSGLFTRFPLLHMSLLSTYWARSRLFTRLSNSAIEMPKEYIPQTIYETSEDLEVIIKPGNSNDLLVSLGEVQKALVLGRSGSGKSVLLRYLIHETLRSDRKVNKQTVPVLVNLRTCPLGSQSLMEAICVALTGQGVELPSKILQFLVRKGGFLILIDSLNEADRSHAIEGVHRFLNGDANNRVIIASQLDLLERRDVHQFRLRDVGDAEAACYLQHAVGFDVWTTLPTEIRQVARNPQDLAVLAQVLKHCSSRDIGEHRSELYRLLLLQDSAFREWVANARPEIRAVYAVAFEMYQRQSTPMPLEEVTRSIAKLKLEQQMLDSVAVEDIRNGLEGSHMFRLEEVVSKLGIKTRCLSFKHELCGAFLAARHLRNKLEEETDRSHLNLLKDTEPSWIEVLFFLFDEIDSLNEVNELLIDLLERQSKFGEELVAYIVATRGAHAVEKTVEEAYRDSKLKHDLKNSPLRVV